MERLPGLDNNALKKKAAKQFQVGEAGFSHDYIGQISAHILYCKRLVNNTIPNPVKKKEAKEIILGKIQNFPKYTEYMDQQAIVDGFKLSDFLTDKGKKSVARFDQIALELRGLYVKDPGKLNVEKVLELFNEMVSIRDTDKA